jgi:hypothetical protein
MPNDVVAQGLEYILETSFTEAQSVPANFYVGLCEDEVLETDGLADLTELSGGGYSRQTVASDNTDFTEASTGTNDRKITTKTVTFTATGTWNGALYAFIATTIDDSGKLVCGVALSVERFLTDGDTLQISIVIIATG